MNWQADGVGCKGESERWAAVIEQDERQGWVYNIRPLDSEEPSCMGNGISIEQCKRQVAAMIAVMERTP